MMRSICLIGGLIAVLGLSQEASACKCAVVPRDQTISATQIVFGRQADQGGIGRRDRYGALAHAERGLRL
jgi:hypothetical protein